MIGWAFDSKGKMAPFDGPALAAAKVRIGQINAKGGVLGRPFKIVTCDTNNNNPAKAKSCAASLLGQGANIIFTTCDVDFATPVVQESLKAGKLTVAPCIGTDQMGPKRFGTAGKLAFSFGNVAQDEGSAMAEYAYRKGWRTANLATNTLLVYFKNVVQAFDKRFTQLGGKIAGRESYATGANNVNTAVSRLNGRKADVIVTSTAFGELPALVSGLRSLGNKTPILNSWAGDGTYWLPKDPQVTNYYAVTYASVVRRRPEPGRPGAGGQAVQGVHRRLRHRLGRDRRRRDRDPALRRLHERRDARRDDGEVQEGADALRARQLLAAVPHRLRAAVPRDQDPQQQGALRRRRDRQGRPEDLGLGGSSRIGNERRPGGTLRASSVSRSFTGVRALDDVSLELHRHEVVGLIGPNGAGKSTLVNVLTGFDLPTAGTVELEERDVTGWSPHRRARAGHRADLPAQPLVPRPDGARERRGRGARRRLAAGGGASAEPTISSRCSASTETRSRASSRHGDERLLGVARALATQPAFVLLDEPAAGLSEAEVPAFAAVVRVDSGRPRRGRAPDRPQHGARDGGLRPDPRARPGAHARRGLARRDPRATST